MANFLQNVRSFFASNPIVFAEYKGETMTVKYKDGTTKRYQGDCTVWNELPFMNRCTTDKEAQLCELWKYNKKWGGAYPNAHLPKF